MGTPQKQGKDRVAPIPLNFLGDKAMLFDLCLLKLGYTVRNSYDNLGLTFRPKRK